MKKYFLFALCIGFLTSCASKQDQSSHLTSIQIIDRNGFKETVNAQDRLAIYEKVNFQAPQPYTKVTRIYARNDQGKTHSRMTSYHENGELWQYLDIVNGRACGTYREWYSNGRLRLDIGVMEGLGDLVEEAQMGWIFDGISRVWDEQGHLAAEIYYEKGLLQGNALYYYPNGNLSKLIPYERDVIHGDIVLYDENGDVKGKTPYRFGSKQGIATFRGDQEIPPYTEEYQNDLLIRGTYHDFLGNIIAKVEGGDGKKAIFDKGKLVCIEEYQKGVMEGEVELFDGAGNLKNRYTIKDGLKHGEEWVYFPSKGKQTPQPKLYLEWYEDTVQGISRSWYQNGVLESEREMHDNHKQGVSSAWYRDGSIMLVEEYENDDLQRGTYMKRGNPTPVSSVENGEGTATLYDPEGHFLKRVTYKKGEPIDEPIHN